MVIKLYQCSIESKPIEYQNKRDGMTSIVQQKKIAKPWCTEIQYLLEAIKFSNFSNEIY